MASSTSNLDLVSASQASKEVTVNAALNAASPATLFGLRASTTAALTFGYYGGVLLVDGMPTVIANGTIALTANLTNYIECDRAGTVTKNTTAFTPGLIPLYSVVTGAATITSWIDYRLATPRTTGRFVKAMADANYPLLHGEARSDILEFTGTLTAQRNIVVPLAAKQWTVFNGTTGGFGLQFIGATGTGIVVAAAKRAIIYSDGTNVVRASPDT